MAANFQGFQFNNTQQSMPQQSNFQTQQFFPQPQGNVYLINNSLEMANVPMGIGVSAALCLSENTLYLKTMQNGQPMVVGYKIAPFEKEDAPQDNKMTEYANRLEKIEKELLELKQQKNSYNLNDLVQ